MATDLCSERDVFPRGVCRSSEGQIQENVRQDQHTKLRRSRMAVSGGGSLQAELLPRHDGERRSDRRYMAGKRPEAGILAGPAVAERVRRIAALRADLEPEFDRLL